MVQGSSRRGLSHIRTPAGTLTADPQEVDEALRASDAWGGIFARYMEEEEPRWDDFVERYRNALPERARCEHGGLSGEDLQSTLMRMSGTKACGLDGWRVLELKALPLPLLQILAEALQRVENEGVAGSAHSGFHMPDSQGVI